MADNSNQLTNLINQITREAAEYEMRVANYFTPFGFDPEPQDFERARQLLADHGTDLASTVFAQASPNLQERTHQVALEWNERQQGIEALKQAGAECNLTGDDLYAYAVERVFTPRAVRSA